MSEVVTVLSLGLLLGLQHATDADHVVAVTTVVARERRVRAAARIGVLWGLGHSATVLVVGGAMVASGVVIPERVAQALELCVAAMLIYLGVAGIRRAFEARRAAHAHLFRQDEARPDEPRQDEARQSEARHGAGRHDVGRDGGHVHVAGALRGDEDRRGLRGAARPVVVGVVHGLAGSAAIALAVLATLGSRTVALGYLATFSLGTIVGMSLVTALISTPIAVATKRVDGRWLLRIAAVAGLASVCFGAWMVYEIGVVDGLFFGDAQAAAP